MPNWVSHAEFFAVFFAIIGGSFVLLSRMDTMRQENHQAMQQQSQRTDKLYEMFIELVKEKK